jgi:DNA-binding transcriptional ArsR family regulator
MHGDIKMPKPDPVENTNNRQFTPATAKAVDKMVKTLVNDYELYSMNDALGKAALCFVAQCDLPEDYDLLYDDEETPDSGSEDGIEFEVREQLMITAFFETKVLRNIIDYFLTSNIPEQGQNLSQIVEGVDVTRNSVSSQIDVLLQFNFLAEHGEGRIKRYMLNSDIEYTSIIVECNNKLGEVWEKNGAEIINRRGKIVRSDTDDAPLVINEMMASEVRRKILDYTPTGTFPEDGLNQSALGDRADVSRNSVMRHIDVFVESELLEDTGASGIRQYRPTDNAIRASLIELNEVLGHHYNTEN